MSSARKRGGFGLLAAVMLPLTAIIALAAVVGADSPSLVQEPTASIRGVVRDESGSAVPDARVILWPALGVAAADADAYAPAEGRSSGDGAFQVPVVDGVYHVLVRVPGYRWGHRLGVTAVRNESVDVGAIQLRRGASLVGTLTYATGEPAPGVAMGLYFSADDPAFLLEDWAPQPTTTTRSDGSFRFDGLAPGGHVDLWMQVNPSRRQYATLSAPEAGAVEDRLALVLRAPRIGAAFVVEVVSDTGEPIEDARLYLSRIPARPTSGGTIAPVQFTPLPGGRYEALPLEPGLHRLTVRAPLHRGQERADLELAAGDNGTMRFELERVPSLQVDLALTTFEGVPVPEHEVRLTRLGSLPTEPYAQENAYLDVGYQHERASTDEAGLFVFEDVPQGRYRIEANDLALGQATRELELAPGGASSIELAFPAAEGPVGTTLVRVLDPEGNPVSDAYVGVDRRARPYRTSDQGRTGADGTFAFRALVDDAVHAIRVERSGYQSSYAEHRLDEGFIDQELVVTLSPRDRGRSTVTGRIVGVDPRDLHRVSLTRWPSYVRADGSFVIHGVEPGEQVLEILTDRWHGVQAPFTVTIARDGDTVDAGDVVVGGFRVTGVVYYQGEPMRNGSVYLDPAEPERRTAGGSALLIDGRYTLTRVQAGRYHLIVRHAGWGRIHDEVIEFDGNLDLDLRLGAAMVSGTVIDAETGAPLNGDRLRLFFDCVRCTRRSHERPDGIEIGPGGRWRAGPLEAGTWRLRLNRSGYVPLETRIEIGGGIDVEVPIELTPTPGLGLVFETARGPMPDQVAARLLDNAGNEVARNNFYDRSGLPRVHWDGAPPGTWILEASGRYARPARRQVTIPGPPVTISLPTGGLLLARIPALKDTITPAVLVVLDAEGQPVAGYMADGTPVVEWIAPGSGQIYARRIPPGSYTARVTAGDRAWEQPFEIEPFASITVTLRGPGR